MSENLKKETVKYVTLGCRLNQYETQAMRESLESRGFCEAAGDQRADVYVLNTCTVTNDSDRTSRYLIRKFHRENPNAKIIVTGCYVERNRNEVASLPGVTHVLLNRQKSDIADLLDSCTGLALRASELPLRSKSEFTPLSISEFAGKTRAHIKVQDGCNHACSFCKVVLVRGKSRSRPLQDIIEEAKRLSENGYSEVVLTGIQLGAYGLDLASKISLVEVIRELESIEKIKRIRLSSIEPIDVTDELIQAMKESKKACPHLHIPLQSGSDEVLKAMNRRYGREFYIDLIQKLKSKIPDFVLTADVMVGFPAETDFEFEETVQLLEQVKPFKLHVFPYSAREGTRAFALGVLDPKVIRRRQTVLNQLDAKLRAEVLKSYVSRTLEILIENETEGADYIEGRAVNYLPARFDLSEGLKAGDIVSAVMQSSSIDALSGKLEKELIRD